MLVAEEGRRKRTKGGEEWSAFSGIGRGSTWTFSPYPPPPPLRPNRAGRGGGGGGRGKRSRSNPFHFLEKALLSSSLLVLFFRPSLSYLHGFPARTLSFAPVNYPHVCCLNSSITR